MALDRGEAYEMLPQHDSPPLAGLMVPGISDDLACTMAEKIMAFAPASDAEALKLLRAAFPNAALSLRVAALDFLMRRRRPVSL
jgi:hypothetical protein